MLSRKQIHHAEMDLPSKLMEVAGRFSVSFLFSLPYSLEQKSDRQEYSMPRIYVHFFFVASSFPLLRRLLFNGRGTAQNHARSAKGNDDGW
jgi:hypothetical protein